MNESLNDPGLPSFENEPAPPRRRSWAWLAWMAIVGLAVFMVLGRRGSDEDREAARDNNVAGLLMKMQGRYLVGAEELLHQKAFYEAAKAYRKGGVDQRLRFVVLANELAGPGEALKELDHLDKDMAEFKIQPSLDQARLRFYLGGLYRDYSRQLWKSPSLTQANRTFIRNKLDWFGDLALAPGSIRMTEAITPLAGGAAAVVIPAQSEAPDPEARAAVLAPARRTFIMLISTVLLMLFIAIVGFIGLIVFIVFVVLGKVKGMQTGTGNGGIYAETFAVWFLLFVGQSFVLSLVSLGLPPLAQAAGIMLLSLLALGWPVLRGIPWRQVRDDLGLNFGKNPLLEPIIGLGCYAMALPIVALGLVVTLVLLQAQRNLSDGAGNPFAPTDVPTHPIVETLAHGGWTELLGVLFLASVAAPLIEETMFRGVLYRHLREASARFGPVLSFFVSGILVSFLFAVIHPQGIFAVPVLMALAFGFTIAREWRGSLVPAMVGHALNNCIVTLVLAAALGD